MKKIKLSLAALILSVTFTSCTKDNEDPIVVEENPMADYNMLTALKANNHSIEVYSEKQKFTVGYNELFLRIMDEATDCYLKNTEISWMPVMHMTEMMHSCPKSEISQIEEASVQKGFLVFQMPGNADEYWELTFDYTIDGQTYNSTERIEVTDPANGKKTVNSFMGSDNTRYILTMIPMEPEVKINDFSAVLFKMEDMMTFPIVKDYKVTIDPRMPGMGNHSSPNNEDLTYNPASKMYRGKLSLTRTGYWKINLKLMNPAEEVLKGETVSEDNDSSSLFFEIEF